MTVGAAAVLLIAMPADFARSQGTVISVTGPATPVSVANGYNGLLGVGTSLAGVSWLSTAAFSNVNISVVLQGNAGAAGVAFLMTKVGPGTTTANQVAEATFAFPAASSLTPVLSGLNLGAGKYFLIIQQTVNGNTGYGAWLGTASPTVTSAAHVTANGDFTYYDSFPSYIPSSAFNGQLITYFDYTITGSPVPEPTAAWLVSLGCGILILGRKKSNLLGHLRAWRPH